MQGTTLVGIDLGKHSFHLHGQSRTGTQTLRKKVTRKQLLELFVTAKTCTVVMEVCAGSHHMARTLAALGHTVKLISPQFVKPFVNSNKNDFVDAEAICEVAARPVMRFVTPRTEAQQTFSALHRVRESFVQDRVKTVNQIHGFLLEFGISLPVGNAVIARLPAVLSEHSLPPRMVSILERLHAHFGYLSEQIAELDKEMGRQFAEDDLGTRLMTIPGVGPVTANLLGISKRGNKTIRRLLVQCARAYMRRLEYEWCHDLPAAYVRSTPKYSVEQKNAAVAYSVTQGLNPSST
ncbi:IS110 family RNA-guided transposase [Paraburkholderia caffeinilytica]|uniref:IS110 family transposase n=1 Tax=Paraburkholderia caffeinilytica TaxID=1761016 RepID=UPI0038BBC07A